MPSHFARCSSQRRGTPKNADFGRFGLFERITREMIREQTSKEAYMALMRQSFRV